MSQPVPPSWKDLGKAASDLLGKEYPTNGSLLEVKTKAPNGVAFKVVGARDGKSGIIAGDLEAKWEDRKNGFALTQGWTTGNVLKNTIELDSKLAKGLKLELVSSLLPDKQAKNAVLGSHYKQPGVHTRQFIDIFKGPIFTADAVVGRDGFLAGAEASYDIKSGRLSRYNLALGYHAPEYAVTAHGTSNLTTFAASYYHRVNADTEAGARATYDSKTASDGKVNLEVGTKVYLDNAAFVKAKINSVGVLCLGYTQALRPGVKASLGLALDTAKLAAADSTATAHKAGFELKFDA